MAVKVCIPRALSAALVELLKGTLTSVRSARRQAIQCRAVRFAAWNIDGSFPAIDQTLEKMNGIQSVFAFQLAALSKPIDAWDLENRVGDGTPYLPAEKLARRVKHLTVELRVNVLACITRSWLCDDEWLNLYGGWPSKREPPVIILSCAGVEDLPTADIETDRAVVNVALSGLTGLPAEMDSYDGGDPFCPMAFDQARDYSKLTGRQAFDTRCKAKLKKKFPTEIPALDAPLKTFYE